MDIKRKLSLFLTLPLMATSLLSVSACSVTKEMTDDLLVMWDDDDEQPPEHLVPRRLPRDNPGASVQNKNLLPSNRRPVQKPGTMVTQPFVPLQNFNQTPVPSFSGTPPIDPTFTPPAYPEPYYGQPPAGFAPEALPYMPPPPPPPAGYNYNSTPMTGYGNNYNMTPPPSGFAPDAYAPDGTLIAPYPAPPSDTGLHYNDAPAEQAYPTPTQNYPEPVDVPSVPYNFDNAPPPPFVTGVKPYSPPAPVDIAPAETYAPPASDYDYTAPTMDEPTEVDTIRTFSVPIPLFKEEALYLSDDEVVAAGAPTEDSPATPSWGNDTNTPISIIPDGRTTYTPPAEPAYEQAPSANPGLPWKEGSLRYDDAESFQLASSYPELKDIPETPESFLKHLDTDINEKESNELDTERKRLQQLRDEIHSIKSPDSSLFDKPTKTTPTSSDKKKPIDWNIG